MIEALVGCVAGAVLVNDTERMAREAGLQDIKLNPKPGYVDGMTDWQDPLYQKILAQLPPGSKPGDYITSLEVAAQKPLQNAPAVSPKPQSQAQAAAALEIYDPPMCCSTGVCGPRVDPVLVRFAADVKWLQEQGVPVRRFNLSQSPAAFFESAEIKKVLDQKGEAALPAILVAGKLAASGRYPEREELLQWTQPNQTAASLYSPAVNELVAMGAAIAANCEPCFKYHYREAQLLGVSKADMASAVATAAMVKDSPHQSILRLADKLTGSGVSAPEPKPDACCGSGNASGKCCG